MKCRLAQENVPHNEIWVMFGHLQRIEMSLSHLTSSTMPVDRPQIHQLIFVAN